MWHKLAINPIIVDSLYGYDQYPLLDNALIRELSWGDIPNMVKLSFEPINLPSKYPSRWHDRHYNRVVVKVEIYDVSKFQVDIIEKQIRGDIKLTTNLNYCL